jgi:hypothetical protein
MCTFNKGNGTHPNRMHPVNNLKKFFDMSKFKPINPVLQRNGQKNSHAPYNLRDTKYFYLLG